MRLNLKYNKPAENSAKGWEEYSLPLGNGFIGANIFGGIDLERIQITENSMVNPGEGAVDSPDIGGLTSFADLYIKFQYPGSCEDAESSCASAYERGLCLDNAVTYTRYTVDGVEYKREYFASYPDKVLAVKLTASKAGALAFDFKIEIPFLKDYSINPGDHGGRDGQVTVDEEAHVITASGTRHFYHILYEGQAVVMTDGRVMKSGSMDGTGHMTDFCTGEGLMVTDATEAVILFAAGTNYKLCPEVFQTDGRMKKTLGEPPHEKVSEIICAASKKTYEELYERHIEDYQSLFGRVELDLGEDHSDAYTDELLLAYRNGNRSKYLEVLYFQYGRYLLIASSRKGGLPANLQGIWNCHEMAPWGSGYWHNINVQMNYWPAFNTNLAELFEPYAEFFGCFFDSAGKYAKKYIEQHNPENLMENAEDRDYGFTVGTATYPYYITGPGGHSGPGTTALTTKLFWEYYDFTRDERILKNVSYKALEGASKFLTKTVRDYDGEYLTSFSASPEQMHHGPYIRGGNFCQTVGCAFDQQMIYENGKDFLKAAEVLHIEDEAVQVQKEQIEKYHPVRVGWSGQIKEFIEEKFYGELGEYHHRHISHLVGLYPGTSINGNTPAWLDAAKFSLTERGDKSTGWALAHRLNAWARVHDGDHAHKLIEELIGNRTNPNLWDEHPPFQIDGNFGGTAGMAEMLLQSHEGYISLLAALPECWNCGSVKGLTARGAFVVDMEWKDMAVVKAVLHSMKGGTVEVRTNNPADGKRVIDTEAGKSYELKDFAPYVKGPDISNLQVKNSILTWDGGKADIYRAVDGAPCYEKLAVSVEAPFADGFDVASCEIVTYKVSAGGREQVVTLNHATKIEKERYIRLIESKNPDIELSGISHF